MEPYSKNCTSIFRPWDTNNCPKPIRSSKIEHLSYQDCTISTTTDNECTNEKTTNEETQTENVNEKPNDQIYIANEKTKQKRNVSTTIEKNNKITKRQQKLKDNCDKKQKKQQNSQTSSPLQYRTEIDATYTNDYFNVPIIDIHSQPVYSTNALYDFSPLIVPTRMGSTDTTSLPPIDPVVMESLAVHGYAAMEEYVRIMNHEQQTKLLNNRKQRPKKYKCPHCNVGFSNNGQLKGHIRIHTGERPFRCDEKNCGKTFTRNEELTRHKRIHSGLRPFPCNACGKRFGRKDHLKKHTKTHITASQRNGLQLVPVVLPAGAWASIPPTSGIPIYNPVQTPTAFHHPHHTPSVPFSTYTPSSVVTTPMYGL